MPIHIAPRRPRWRALAVPVAIAAVGATAPSAPAASTLSPQNGPVGNGLNGRPVLIADRVTLLHDEPLDVNAQLVGGNIAVTDAAGTVNAGAGCVKVGATVLCPAAN